MIKPLDTIEEKLDCVLDYFRRNRNLNNEEYQITAQKADPEYKEILHFLYEGNYIQDRENITYPQITIKGMLFEGFVNEKARLKAESERISQLEIRQMETQESLRNLNFWLVVVTSLICGLEILKICMQDYPCFPSWYSLFH